MMDYSGEIASLDDLHRITHAAVTKRTQLTLVYPNFLVLDCIEYLHKSKQKS